MTNEQGRYIITRCKSNDLFFVYLLLILILLESCSTGVKVSEIREQLNEIDYTKNQQINPQAEHK